MGAQTSKHWECEAPVPIATTKGRPTSPSQAAVLTARAKKTTSRIAAAQAKAEVRDRHQAERLAQHSAKEEEKRSKRAEGEIEAQELKSKRIAAEAERTETRARGKQEEEQARAQRRQQDERRQQEEYDEKRRKTPLEGVAWGFDERAGKRSATTLEEPEGCYVSDGRAQDYADAHEEVDSIGRRTGRRWHRGNTWGVEAGGPGKEVAFEPGVPVDPTKPKSSGSWKRKRKD